MSTCTLWPVTTNNESSYLDELAFQRQAENRSLRDRERPGSTHIGFHDRAIHYAKSATPGSLSIYHGAYGEYLTFFLREEDHDLATKLASAINAVLADHHAVRTQQEAAE